MKMFRAVRVCWSLRDLYENHTLQRAYVALLPRLIQQTKWILQKTPRHQRHRMKISFGPPDALYAMRISVKQEVLWPKYCLHHMYNIHSPGLIERPWEDIALPRILNKDLYVGWNHLEDVCDPRQEIADMLIDTLLQDDILGEILMETKPKPLGTIEEEMKSHQEEEEEEKEEEEENHDSFDCSRGIFVLDDLPCSNDEISCNNLTRNMRKMAITGGKPSRKNLYPVKYGDNNHSNTSTASATIPPESKSLDGYLQFHTTPPTQLLEEETDDEWSGYIDAYVDSPQSNISM
jgi:hypothetical protein